MISFRTHGLLGFLLLTQANQVALHFPVTPARSSILPRLGFWAEGKRLALRGGSACAVLVTAVDEERGSSCPVQVHSGLTIAELKGLLEPEFNIPAADQDILLGGKCLLDAQTLAESSITDNSLIAVRRKSSEQNHAQPVPQPSKFDVSALQNAMRLAGFSQTPGTPNLDSSVASAGPPLDPMDARAQAQIEEQIKHANVQENLRLALEHTPEAFGRVSLIRVRCHVNGAEVIALVDTGAEATVMSSACAERLGLMRLVDERFQGTALGVGSAKIVGRVHVVPLKIGESFLSVSLQVLEPEDPHAELFLFGLDNLRRHQCCVDLKHSRLVIGGTEEAVPFLSEAEARVGDAKLEARERDALAASSLRRGARRS